MRYWTALAPRAHAYRARWSTWTARRANALRLTGRNKYHLLGLSQKVLFSNNNKISKAQRLFVYFAESISPITVSFCPTTAK